MTTPVDALDERALPAIVALCRRGLRDAPTEDELAGALFAPDQPAQVRGDPDVGIVASTTWGEHGFVRLLVVDPDHRGHGHGRALLDAAEADLREQGVGSVTVGADAPYYLFPGVETTELAMLCLLERRKYWRTEANFNMDVDLDTIPPDEGGASPATAGDRDEVDRWMAQHWEMWRPEVLRALDKGTLLLSRDDEGISAFCAYDVNRRGLLGPVAVRPALMGRGAGRAALVAALHRMRADGQRRIEVAWVGPVVPYARVGGTVGRVFFVYKKNL